jgi:catechol 2,3-dioxygenase-like lactoylglutathione lyase family enzyme
MLANFPVMPTLPVSDLARARAFYEGLGFSVVRDDEEGLVYQAGSTSFLVFPTPNAGTNKATAMGFGVPDENFDDEIADLRGRGVSFMTFDAPSGSWHDGVLAQDALRSAWFADPDGNVLALSTMAATP